MRRLQRAWSRLTGEEGYSLIELVVTVAILGTVLAAITTLFVSGSKAELDMNRRFTAQQNARIALSSLRSDIHVAGCANIANSGKELDLYATPALSCSGTATTVRWCALASTALTGRFALYRAGTAGQSCTTSAKQFADYLSTVSFAWNPPATGSLQLGSVSIDLVAATNPKSVTADSYELTDAIVLRNGQRG